MARVDSSLPLMHRDLSDLGYPDPDPSKERSDSRFSYGEFFGLLLMVSRLMILVLLSRAAGGWAVS